MSGLTDPIPAIATAAYNTLQAIGVGQDKWREETDKSWKDEKMWGSEGMT